MPRFKDPRLHLYDFADIFLVQCPSCSKCATVTTNSEEKVFNLFKKKTFVCYHCGRIEEGSNNHELWLVANCKGNTLWAYNLRHLEFIENYVQAKLRESNKHEKLGWYNQGLVSRLPKWIKEKNNREVILKTINKLKGSVDIGKNK
ncbi:hypothetical protein [Paenibacillus durus]|uniref:hypothetical protein n=1 Tax=Paenibacillus durus TaxID=44251 RepID=UPI0012E01CAA|nr:hypothetical protein [Paenibacillus durus]